MKTILLSLLAITLLCSCSKVQIFSKKIEKEGDVKYTEQKGLEFYYPQPYLLITKSTTTEGESIESQIVYLPDLDRPMVAKLKPGFGSSKLSIALQNGMISSIGQEVDSKVPETLTSITGLLGSLQESMELNAEPSVPELWKITSSGLVKIEFKME